MLSFDVLSRQTDVNRNYLLEASAGTGKTFALEHLFVRLLLENDRYTQQPIRIEAILAVTFTRAAVADLRQRIQLAIQNAVRILKNRDLTTNLDYLSKILEESPEFWQEAIGRLELALVDFDQASILTIHGFCYRILSELQVEGEFAHNPLQTEKQISTIELSGILRDFFRTKVDEANFPPVLLRRLLRHFSGQSERLENNLKSAMTQSKEIVAVESYQQNYENFCYCLQKIRQKRAWEKEAFIEDCQQLLPHYLKLPEAEESAQFLGNLLEQSTWSYRDFDVLLEQGVVVAEAINPKRLKKNKKPPDFQTLHYPDFPQILHSELVPLVNSARDPARIFANLASACQKQFKAYLQKEEKLWYDNLLQKMAHAIENPAFCQQVQDRFLAVLIDEFQDTDPLQWEIFKTLFLQREQSRPLILVGDPKQSIYAFRSADIYTYLKAAKAMGQEAHRCLEINYRSQQPLIDALNQLFASAPLFPLPELATHLEYRKVKCGSREVDRTWNDGFAALHFSSALGEGYQKYSLERIEREAFFPFIVNQIRLHIEVDGFPENALAILVSDRLQAKRLSTFLKEQHLPVSMKREAGLQEMTGLTVLCEFLQAIVHFRDLSRLKICLGGPLFGWTFAALQTLDDPLFLERECERFRLWQSKAQELGAITLLYDILPDSNPELWPEFSEVLEFAASEMKMAKCSPKELLIFCQQLLAGPTVEDELVKNPHSSLPGIKILTIHSSKGLEYPIVFALGLISRPPRSTPLLVTSSDRQFLQPFDPEGTNSKQGMESDAEKMRHLYVALTRAKYRLYLPLWQDSRALSHSTGQASACELLLQHLNEARQEKDLRLFLTGLSDGISVAEIVNPTLTAPKIQIQQAANPPLTAIIKAPKKTIFHSFTSLYAAEGSSLEAKAVAPPSDYETPFKSIHTLPANAETGLILHALLEKLPRKLLFQAQDRLDLLPWLNNQLARSPYAAWSKILLDLVWQAISTPLLKGSWRQSKDSFFEREMEFLYTEGTDCFYKGIIDLILCQGGECFVVDWKSNWLGPDLEAYRPEKLTAAMQENHYHMQAQLYATAVERQLGTYNLEQTWQFKGCYYLFLRGLSEGTQSGVHFVPANLLGKMGNLD